MRILKTKFKDLLIVKSEIFRDKRGIFKEAYKKKIIKKNLIFDCLSQSKKNTIRGLHFQRTNPQGKFITVVHGEILDVAVDLRKNSKTFGKHFSIRLNDKNCTSVFIPPGFAHGFLVISEEALVEYKCTDFYDPDDEGSIIWNDPSLNIDWPLGNPIVSIKDSEALSFDEIIK